MSWLDSLIEWISPSWGAQRLMERQAIELGYRAGSHTRVGRAMPTAGSADWQNEVDGRGRVDLLRRARQIERDSALACALLDRQQENVIGCGHQPQADSGNERWNRRAERLFADWADDPALADARGIHSFGELQGLLFRSGQRDGDVGAIKMGTGHLQAVEGDRIVSPRGHHSTSPGMIDGVELDSLGRPTKYHVGEFGLYGTLNATKAIPSDEFVFYARRSRLGQTRGITVFAQTLHHFDQIDSYIEAVIMSARMAACFGLIIQNNGKFAGLSKDSEGRRRLKLEPAAVLELKRGETATTLAPAQHQAQLDTFIKTFARLAGLSFGIPAEIGVLMFDRSNYSNTRASMVQAQSTWRCQQRDFQAQFLRNVWRWKIDEFVARGMIEAHESRYRHTWTGPGWTWIDPTKEIESALLAVDAGLDTRTNIMRRQGREFDDVLRTLKLEADAIERSDVIIGRSSRTRDVGQTIGQTEPQPEPEPDQDDEDENALPADD